MPTHTNPFPGMNPYFQDAWQSVHTRLITYISDALSSGLPPDLNANPETNVVIDDHENPRNFRLDVAVADLARPNFPPVRSFETANPTALAVADPIVFEDEPAPQRWIEIREANGMLVTVIELLSPSNKRGEGIERYRAKRNGLISSGVALVEIDLIRGGQHVTAIDLERLSFPRGTCHHVCVARPSAFERREVYLCPLREPLPTIRVPLRPTDCDVPLAIQSLVDRGFEASRFWLHDCTKPPHPPVADEDTEWVAERLRAAGLRQ